MRMRRRVRQLAGRLSWVLCAMLGVAGLVVGIIALSTAHPTRPVRTEGRIASYAKVTTTDGTYLRNQLQLAGDAQIYTLDRRQFRPPLPEALYANGKVTIWVDAGTRTVVAITLYDQDDMSPVTSTTDSYTHPGQALQRGRLEGAGALGVGLALDAVAGVWLLRARRRTVDLGARIAPASTRRSEWSGRRTTGGPPTAGEDLWGWAQTASVRGSQRRSDLPPPGYRPMTAPPSQPARLSTSSGPWQGLPPLDAPPAASPSAPWQSGAPSGAGRPAPSPGAPWQEVSAHPAAGMPPGAPPHSNPIGPPSSPWPSPPQPDRRSAWFGPAGPPSPPAPQPPRPPRPSWGPASRPAQPGQPPGQPGWPDQRHGHGQEPGSGPSQGSPEGPPWR